MQDILVVQCLTMVISVVDEERERIISRGIVQFRADEPLMRALLDAADHFHIPPGVLARSWVADQLTDPIDVVDLIKRQEDGAYKEVRTYLKNTGQLLGQLLGLYDLLSVLLGKTKNRLDANQLIALLHCMQSCRYQMIIGNLCCLRGHPFDQSSYRRKAIEFCAFAIKMLRSPEHAQVWMNAISNRAYDKYESKFPIMACISEAEDLMGPRLKKTYGVLSQQIHASPFAVATQVRVETINGQATHLLDYFQHQTDSKKQFLAMTFLSGIESDYLIIKALAGGIAEVTESFDQVTWDTAISHFDALRYAVKDAWAPTLDPTGHYRQGKKPPRPGKKAAPPEKKD